MNMDPVKNIGKFKEQIEMEYKSRRLYPHKWSPFYESTLWKEIYNQNEINKKLKTEVKDQNPFKYSNEGDSYFLSPEMHKSLISLCRCGRSRSDLHLLKCLQNQQDKYSLKTIDDKQEVEGEEEKSLKKIPETSNSFVGWQMKRPSYKQWENSMKYISPIYDMPGEKITATPYNAIIIG